MQHHNHTAFEIAESVSGKTESALKSVKAIAASEAFRRYNWLTKVPVRNAVGNLRGMVVSSRWAAAYHITEDVLKPIGDVALIASLAVNLSEASHEISRIVDSNSDWGTKSAQLSSQVSAVSLRTLGGVVPAMTHLLALTLEGYCQIGGLVGIPQVQQSVDKLKEYDTKISSTFQRITDGDNVYCFITNHIMVP